MTQEPNSERALDARLDEALEMTFPASVWLHERAVTYRSRHGLKV